MKSPKQPKPTAQEVELQNRQREEMANLDEEENVRFKRALRGRLGARRLVSSGSRSSSASTAGAGAGAAAGDAGGSRMTIPRAPRGSAAY